MSLPQYNRAELAEAAEQAFRRTFPGLSVQESRPITERTIRFWTKEQLLASRGGPNRPALYDQGFVNRCVFIRRLRLEDALSLQDIRSVLARVDEATIARVATGEEPLRLVPAAGAAAAQLARDGERVLLVDGATGSAAGGKQEPGDEVFGRSPAERQVQTDDRPDRLGVMSDASKARAIAQALGSVTGGTYRVIIECVNLLPSYKRIGPFLAPACIDCGLSAENDAELGQPSMELIQHFSDDEICTAIAREFSRQTNEPLQVIVTSKRYSRGGTVSSDGPVKHLRLSLAVARKKT